MLLEDQWRPERFYGNGSLDVGAEVFFGDVVNAAGVRSGSRCYTTFLLRHWRRCQIRLSVFFLKPSPIFVNSDGDYLWDVFAIFIWPDWKVLRRTNTLAYFASMSLTLRSNNLECLPPASFLDLSNILNLVLSLPESITFQLLLFWGRMLALPSNIRFI